MKQKVTVPSYFAAFDCIASKCEETCCAGWYIAIDEAAYKKYKKVKQPEMKKRLEKEIVERKGAVSKECVAKIKLKNNRCAFLAKDNLCDIYKNLGENYLSETCRVYPRNVNQVDEMRELSLALSCPEAARIVLLQKEPITFNEEEDTYNLPVVGGNVKGNNGKPKHFEEMVVEIRRYLLSILQNRNLSFEVRWKYLKAAFIKLDQIKKKQDMKALAALLSKGAESKSKDKYMADSEYKTKDGYESKDEGRVKDSENALPVQELIEMKKTWQALIAMRQEKKWPSARYESCYQQMVKGLRQEESASDKESIWSDEKYKQGAAKWTEELAAKWSVILENYFVSYIYERLVPLDQKSPQDSFNEMAFYYQLIKLHLVGILMEKGQLSEEDMITVIQSFTRVFDHNDLCRQQLKKLL